MFNKRTLILLGILSIAAVIAALYHLDNARLSSYGSLLSAVGSILAVICFTGSLWYQSQQIKEQRTYFLTEFQHLREEGRRNALLLAKDILNTAQEKALSFDNKLTGLIDLFPKYIMFSELKIILESDNPIEVQNALSEWMKKEGAALVLMRGLKSAAQIYFTAIRKQDVDYSKEPEEFVYIYGTHLWSLPFFETFQSPANPLSEVMCLLTPGRQAALMATYGVMVRMAPDTLILKMEDIRKEVKRHKDKGYPLPKIAEGLLEENQR